MALYHIMRQKSNFFIVNLSKTRFIQYFIKENLGELPGDIIEYETEKVLGKHNGFYFHTIGQKKGLQLSGGP
ncbi:hypothetical protein COB57_04445 [Candidatus Peregrinibacteria bacterium]|nr:MAG: hypothetical protein COB57_04445 [Candidatus Peregrinibacteria bacterium]